MYDYETHTRQLAELESSVHEAREQNVALPKPFARVVSILVALMIVGTFFGTGAVSPTVTKWNMPRLGWAFPCLGSDSFGAPYLVVPWVRPELLKWQDTHLLLTSGKSSEKTLAAAMLGDTPVRAS